MAYFANEKKADSIVIMDMSSVSSVCDYFVVCSATSSVRAKTIAENIDTKMKAAGDRATHREGHQEGKWILLDFGDVVAHIFQQETRNYYNIEQLWGDAPRRVFTEKV